MLHYIQLRVWENSTRLRMHWWKWRDYVRRAHIQPHIINGFLKELVILQSLSPFQAIFVTQSMNVAFHWVLSQQWEWVSLKMQIWQDKICRRVWGHTWKEGSTVLFLAFCVLFSSIMPRSISQVFNFLMSYNANVRKGTGTKIILGPLWCMTLKAIVRYLKILHV